MALAMEQYVASRPLNIGFLGSSAGMFDAYLLAQAIKQPWRLRIHDWISIQYRIPDFNCSSRKHRLAQ